MTTNACTTSHNSADAAQRPITPLRRRMIEDMALRRLAPKTHAHDLRAVERFAKHFSAAQTSTNFY